MKDADEDRVAPFPWSDRPSRDGRAIGSWSPEEDDLADIND